MKNKGFGGMSPFIKGILRNLKIRVLWKEYKASISIYDENSQWYRVSWRWSFKKLKARDPLLNQNNLVYKIDCLDCHGTYIQRRKLYLKLRISNINIQFEWKIYDVGTS